MLSDPSLSPQQRTSAADALNVSLAHSVPDVGVPLATAQVTSVAPEAVEPQGSANDSIAATPVVPVGAQPRTGTRRLVDRSGSAPAAGNAGCFVRGKDSRRRSQQPRLASSKNARAVAHSRGTGQLCKAAVDGSIRGQGAFVIISFSQAGNVNFFSTSEDAGISTDDWLDPELQRWLQTRKTGGTFAANRASLDGGFSGASGIMGRSGEEFDEQQRHGKRQRTSHVSSEQPTIAQPVPQTGLDHVGATSLSS